jgi:alcohol dehydrogenase (cytochrome c)
MLSDSAAGADWPTYGGSYDNQRYSTLTDITPANVDQLRPAWEFQTGIANSFETTPLVVGNTMYLTTPSPGKVIALNAATGEKLWEYTPNLSETIFCCGPNNRGVAAYGDKVFVGTLDAHLIALDARTGKQVWDTRVANDSAGYSITAAPLAYDGKVVIGVSGGEYGIRGRVTAYDANTGKELWRFYTIPGPKDAPNGWWGNWETHTPFGLDLHRDIQKEKADSARYPDTWQRGGGANRMTPAYDPQSHTLFISVGNPSPDLDGTKRPGDNLYTNSIVAIDSNTGQYRWHFQYIHHGVWDLDAVSPPIIIHQNGHTYVAHAGKIGFMYVLDAATGKPVLRSANFVPIENLFTLPTAKGVPMLPGANGGDEWSPMSYSPKTGLAYVMGLHQPMNYATHEAPYKKGMIWLGSAFTSVPGAPQWGTFSAIDASTGKISWARKVSQPMIGGSVATAGGLVFVGEGSGEFDAFDAGNGHLLWQFNCGAGVNAAPMTYSVNGVQYVAVAAGGVFQTDTPRGDVVYAFALPSQRPTATTTTYTTPSFTQVQPVQGGQQGPATIGPSGTDGTAMQTGTASGH